MFDFFGMICYCFPSLISSISMFDLSAIATSPGRFFSWYLRSSMIDMIARYSKI